MYVQRVSNLSMSTSLMGLSRVERMTQQDEGSGRRGEIGMNEKAVNRTVNQLIDISHLERSSWDTSSLNILTLR